MSPRKINKRSSGISQPQNGEIRPVWAFPPRFGKLQGREGLPIHSFRPPASRMRGGRARASSAPCGLGASAAEFRAARKAPSVQLFARLYCRSFRAKSRTAERLWSLTQNFPGNGLRKPRFRHANFRSRGSPIPEIAPCGAGGTACEKPKFPPRGLQAGGRRVGTLAGPFRRRPPLRGHFGVKIPGMRPRRCRPRRRIPVSGNSGVSLSRPYRVKTPKNSLPELPSRNPEAAPAREAHPNRKFFPILAPKFHVKNASGHASPPT